MPSAPSKEELLAQALADFLDRQAREEAPAIEGFCRDHPEIADELRPQLETLAEIDRAVAQVTHPNIARIYALGPDGEPPHFVMEYVEGAALSTAAQPLTLRQKAELMRKVALAVGFLNERQVIHRDLK